MNAVFKRITIAIVVVLVLGAGWYLGSPLFFDTVVDEQMDDTAQTTALLSGMFRDADEFHRGSGTATIYEQPNGQRVLRFEGFDVTNGPSLSVYLAKNGADVSEGFVNVGKLKGNKGNQNYEIPADVDLTTFNTVVIWCVPFKVTFATAELQSASDTMPL